MSSSDENKKVQMKMIYQDSGNICFGIENKGRKIFVK